MASDQKLSGKPFVKILQDELCIEKRAEPCGLVIFGASGDLARRKLIPSLCHLWQNKLLPKNFFVVGMARTPMSSEEFRREVRNSLDQFTKYGPLCQADWNEFISKFFYLSGNYSGPDSFRELSQLIQKLDRDNGTNGNHLFYLATPPKIFLEIIKNLGGSGLQKGKENSRGWSRIVIEKPFGHDLASAQALNKEVSCVFREHQIYRMDHYLGKETVQNVLIFRFANAIFEPLWNRNYVDHVQISVCETLGVGDRAGYYEKAGTLRDMFQNHLLQLLCLVAMEPPANFEADSVRDEKVKVLRALQSISGKKIQGCAVRGQYGRGEIEGKKVSGYREERGVNPGSTTETFAALKIGIDNRRWRGVPFYIRIGKRLPKRASEITIQFKRAPHLLFKGISPEIFSPNVLALRIQPDEGISIRFHTKHPGPKLCMSTAEMDFVYEDSFGMPPPEAYERLLLDCFSGDQTLFSREDWMEISWAFCKPILNFWSGQAPQFPNYPAGAWGPKEADSLIESDGRQWRAL